MDHVPPRTCSSKIAQRKQRSVALQTQKKFHATNTIRESSKKASSRTTSDRSVRCSGKKIASGVYHQEPVHPARYGIAKENAADGYPGILSKSLHGIPNPENGPNPEVKQDPKQKCFFQIPAIVRRLILRLRFIFSRPCRMLRRKVYILSHEKKKEIHQDCQSRRSCLDRHSRKCASWTTYLRL